MKYILNIPFVTLNTYISAERSNRYIAANLKKKLTNAVANALKGQEKAKKGQKYNAHILWYKPNNRSDHDNIAFGIKFILDGMQRAKIIEGDGPKVINEIHHTFKLDKETKYIHCEIELIEI